MGVAFGIDRRVLGVETGIVPAQKVLARYT
jgi:heterodisulfide reductase subunit B